MTGPLDSIGGTAPLNSVQANSEAGSTAMQQLGQLLRLLSDEFAGFSSPGQAAQLQNSIRQLRDAGIPLRDIADAMHSSPSALDAVRDGNAPRAALAIAGWMDGNILELRNSRVPEDRLRLLSQHGFGLGEIVMAMQIVPGLRDELARGDFLHPQQWTQAMHDALRDLGRATHENPALLAAADRHSPALILQGAPWSEGYLDLVRNLQRKFGGSSKIDGLRVSSEHPNQEDEVLLPVAIPAPMVVVTNVHFGAWVAAVIFAIALFVLLLERC